MSEKWIGAIISTDKDLKEERRKIADFLKGKGVEVSAFENPFFPQETGLHSHTNCINALKRVDFAILIINKNSGDNYYYDSNISITSAEYKEIVWLKKPSIVLVYEEAWNESRRFHHKQKKSRMTKDEFAKEYETDYVNSVKVLELIDNIQHQYEETGYSNWITTYNSLEDLVEKVEGKLRGLSRQYLQDVSNAQGEMLRRRRTSTPVAANLGDVFDKNYYIEPNYKYVDGKPALGSLGEQIVTLLDSGNSILIKGEAGYGKTTILAKAFLNNLEKFKEEKGYKIPLLLQLHEKNATYHFDIQKYLKECFDILRKEQYPFLETSGMSFIFYLDGFDELSEEISSDELERISKTTIFQSPFLLTSRSQYAARYLNSYGMYERFSCVINIQKWNHSTAERYIDNFCAKAGKEQDFADTVRKLLSENEELKDILDSPLLISMLLSIIESNGMRYPETIKTRVSLFNKSLLTMAEREHTKNPACSAKDIVMYWAYFSWHVYKNLLIRADEKDLNQMIACIDPNICNFENTTKENLVGAIFEIKGSRICGAFHEQFLEYLVAYALCDACINQNEPYPEFLKYVIRPEINRYFRGIWREESDANRKTIFNNLWRLYQDKLGVDENEAIAIRVHAIYHLTRLEDDNRRILLQKAYNIETHISVKLSLYFGLIKLGDLDKEEEFYKMLEEDNDCNRANRGYHLVYYADMTPHNQSFPYMDDNESEWSGTLNAFRHHFSSEKDAHYFLRRIDLATMRHLILSRNNIKLADPQKTLGVIKYYVYDTCKAQAKQYPEFQKKIIQEFDLLQKTIDGLK